VHSNPHISNPDLIYPSERLKLWCCCNCGCGWTSSQTYQVSSQLRQLLQHQPTPPWLNP
jgi:hypothetical protein